MTLKELTKALGGNEYAPRSEEELLEQANRRYASEYGEKRLAARQAYETADAALAEQMGRTAVGYESQMDNVARQTRASLSEAERSALAKGMQRSSYNAMGLANIQAAGDSGIAAMRQNLLDEQSSLEAQRARIAGQLADKLAQYDISFESDVQAYLDELRNQQYERETAAKKYADKISMALYEYGLKAGGGYSGGSKATGAKGGRAMPQANRPDQPVSNTTAMDKLNQTKKSAATASGVAQMLKKLQASVRRGGFTKDQ